MTRKLNFEHVSESYVRLFRIIGVLPLKGKNSNELGSRILFGYFFCINLLLWSSYVSYFWNESELQIGTVCETVMIVGLSIRYNLLIWKRKKMQNLLEEMEMIWSLCTEEGRSIVLTFQRRMRRLHYFFLCTLFSVNVLYPVNALIIRVPSNEPNRTEYRPLPYRWYAENAEDMWPGYWPIFTIQCIVFLSSVVTAASCGTVFAGLIMITAGYFKYLRIELLRIVELINPDNDSWHLVHREIIRLVKFHQKLLKFSVKLEETFQTILLVLVGITCYNISLMVFKLASSDPDRSKYLSIVLASICNLFVTQWPADCIFDESGAIGEAAYFTSITWMKYQHSKSLVLIIMRAQRPVQIKAGGLIPLSLENFGSMMTSAYSFYTVLRRFDL